MSSLLKKKSVKIALIVTALVLIMAAVSHFSGFNPISAAVKTVFAPFQRGASYVTNKVIGTVDFISEMKSYKEDNERLISEINRLKRENRDITNYREENERLKAMLEMQKSLDKYATVAATVTAYSSNIRYDTIEISKGALSGIAVGNAVITPDGVVGKVTEVGPNWATVSTILNPQSALGVKLSRTNDVAVVEGDEELYGQNYCKMTFIDKDASLIVGDVLETSGEGGIYPAGLGVGSVREINADSMGALNYATVEPAVNFSHLYEVLVINGMR